MKKPEQLEVTSKITLEHELDNAAAALRETLDGCRRNARPVHLVDFIAQRNQRLAEQRCAEWVAHDE